MRYIIGVDEVGRGPLAGPITVAAVVVTGSVKLQMPNAKIPLRDSKRLSEAHREKWVAWARGHPDIKFTTSSVSALVIDRINIVNAARLAATRAIHRLIERNSTARYKVNCDYGIRPKCEYSEFVHGDERIPIIALASIIAKVVRDGKMRRYAKRYPSYSLGAHKGYGTKRHIKAIRKYGLSPIHRASFCRNFTRRAK